VWEWGGGYTYAYRRKAVGGSTAAASVGLGWVWGGFV